MILINLTVAVSKNCVIGVEPNELPWVLPGDLKRFKELTKGQALVMGRKTFDSLGNKPLKGREMLVLTTAAKPTPVKGCKFYKTVNDLIEDNKDKDLWVIGGTQIYNMFLPLADILYITVVKAEIPNGKATFDYYDIAMSDKYEQTYLSEDMIEFDLVSETDITYRFEEWIKR